MNYSADAHSVLLQGFKVKLGIDKSALDKLRRIAPCPNSCGDDLRHGLVRPGPNGFCPTCELEFKLCRVPECKVIVDKGPVCMDCLKKIPALVSKMGPLIKYLKDEKNPP